MATSPRAPCVTPGPDTVSLDSSIKQLRQISGCQICLSGLPTSPTKVRRKRQNDLQENATVAMNFEVEKDEQRRQLLVQAKVRDIIETLSPEFTRKVWGGFSLVWGWGFFFKDSFPLTLISGNSAQISLSSEVAESESLY